MNPPIKLRIRRERERERERERSYLLLEVVGDGRLLVGRWRPTAS